MPIETIVQKDLTGALRPSTDHDQKLFAKIKTGQALRVTLTKVSARSLQHHKLYWGGLIALCMDYWQPSGGLVTEVEKKTLRAFAAFLEKKGKSTGAFTELAKQFLSEQIEIRSEKFQTPDKSDSALHEWIKIEAGYYDLALTPTGIIKRSRSINFNSMSKEEFEVYYQAAFNVVWRYVLSRKFKTEKEAQNAVDQLTSMG